MSIALSFMLWHSERSTYSSDGHFEMTLSSPIDVTCWHLERRSSRSSRKSKAYFRETSVTRLHEDRFSDRSPLRRPMVYSLQFISSLAVVRSHISSMTRFRFASLTMSCSALLRSEMLYGCARLTFG